MTQNVLDTNSYLLNLTSGESGLAKNSTKNYAETFSNGKSFNDIFSKATSNNNYVVKENRFNTNPQENRNANNNFTNNEDRNFNKKENSFVSDVNSNQERNNVKSNKSEERDYLGSVSRDSEKNEVKNSSTNEEMENTTNVNSEADEKVEFSKVADTLSNAEDVTQVADVESQEDIDALNQMLLDDMASEEATQVDNYINAYYQSTMDSLNVVEEDATQVQDVADMTKIVDEIVAEEEVNAEVDTLAMDLVDDVVKADTTKTSDTATTAKTTTTTTDSILKNDVAKSSVKDLTEDAKNVEAADAEVEQVDNAKKVEVDVQTNETSTKQEDVLVNVADDMVDEVSKPVNTTTETSNTKTNFREVMEKAGLDDAKLEALNMTITNSGSSGTDLSNGFQGSAQEDLMKYAIQSGNDKKGVSEISNKEFSKLVDTKNVQQEEMKEISKNDILAQINNKMQAQNINGQKRITLQLTPESLGKITIELTKGKDGLQAKMLTDNAQVRDLLEKNIDGLKSTLANQGVSVNNVSVKVASASESSSDFNFGRENFNGENAQQDFSGTGERRGEENSQGERANNSENLMGDEMIVNNSADEIESELDLTMSENSLEMEEEKVSAGIGNVDLEV